MDNQDNKNIQVILRQNDMEAYLLLNMPLPGVEYVMEELVEALSQKGVVYGIQTERLESIIMHQLFGEEVLVASGTQPQDGQNGFYEYNFNRDFSKKPKKHPDGSVDYWSINMIEMVKEGQEIAIYHKAVQGQNGMTVKSRELKPKLARELAPLKGKGFERSADNLAYLSLMDGKIDMQGERITILPIYEISGDADISVGHIDFNGDLVVHGSVRNGVKLKATGSIIIDGIVESAQIQAGKDIVLRSGVMGGFRSSVKTKANIYAKFFEYTTVEAGGSIQADTFMNCEVFCEQRIIMSSEKGSIVGGNIWAIEGVVATNVGNEAEVRTNIRVGNDIEVLRRMKVLQRKIQVAQENLDKIEQGLKDFEKLENERDVSYRDDPRKIQLLRIKIRDSAQISTDRGELEKLETQIERAQGACVKVNRAVYTGVTIGIDDIKIPVKERQLNVEFVKNMDKIHIMKPIAS
ncbi:FapA family protein [Lachnospiraceae bacterium ZAX-1]